MKVGGGGFGGGRIERIGIWDGKVVETDSWMDELIEFDRFCIYFLNNFLNIITIKSVKS